MSEARSRAAFITGASSGIDTAFARRLAIKGFSVVNQLGNVSAPQTSVRRIESGGGPAPAVKANVSERADVMALLVDAVKPFGGVDVLASNVGISLCPACRPKRCAGAPSASVPSNQGLSPPTCS